MELKVNPKYKQTELGDIPTDWSIALLGDLCEKIGSGVTPSGGQKVYKANGRPFIRSQNIGWGKLLLEDVAFIDDATHASFVATEILVGDVFLNITGASIGRSAVANEIIAGGNVNQHVCIIRVKNYINAQYINYALLANYGQRQVDSFQAGGNRQGLNFGQIKAFQIILPGTIDEQIVIATALSNTDALITSLERLIVKKRNIKQGAMQELLRPKEGWAIEPLGKFVTITSGVSPSKFEFVDSGTPYFKVEQLNNSEKYTDETIYFIQSDNKIRKGSIVFPKRGASIFLNKIRILKVDSYIDTNLMTLTVNDELDNEYLFYQLSYIGLDKIADTTSIPQINNKHIIPFPLPFPKTKDEQSIIADLLSSIDIEIDALKNKLAKYKDIKQGMMQVLLTGKVRLV